MLAEHQVIYLLDEAERTIGRRLDSIRGRLRSKLHVRPAIWELILIDALTRIGKIDYERPTRSGQTPDLFVETANGPCWFEAAYLHPRFARLEERQDLFQRAVWAEERRIGIAPGSLHHDFYGQQVAHGFEMTLPAEHEIGSFFRVEAVKGFFEFIKGNPDQPVMVDLGEYGATVRLAYRPNTRSYGSSSVVIEQPRSVAEHAVFRLLTKKAKKYHPRDLGAPLIVCIGSERSTAVRFMGPMSVSTEAAIQEAYRSSALSGVIIVSVEATIASIGTLNTSRRARVSASVNRSATFALDNDYFRKLQLRFDLLDYGHGWNEWEGVGSVRERTEGLGGTLLWEQKKGGYAVTFPANQVLRALGGGLSASELQATYGMTDAENPFCRALNEGRTIVEIELLSHDARSLEPQKIRITFGPPTPLFLQNPKG